MRVFRALPNPPLELPSSLTIGNFDGVHRGHQALLSMMAADAHRRGQLAGLMTFDPHPVAVLKPDVPHQMLTTVEERLEIVRHLPLDFVVVYPFSLEAARMPAREFVASLWRALQLKSLWTGPDFALGHNREGDFAALSAMGHDMGFATHTIEPQLIEGVEVRSGRIRAYLHEGQVELAADQLGRLYSVAGLVVGGARRGRSLGFPTANLDVPSSRLLPVNGVYATWASVHGCGGQPAQRLASVTNIGVRPSFDNGQRTVETHLLDFDGNLYGCTVTLEFVSRLRPEQRFASVDKLKAQIGRDVEQARTLLA